MENNKPLVSIIMGVHNEQKTIGRCVESIINQSYKNWELIICNDCSTDNTLEIISDYCASDTRIKVINNKTNIRLAASLNRCLKIAKGKYIARMDADDISMTNRLEMQVDYMEKHPKTDCVGCNVVVFDEKGKHGTRIMCEHPTRKTLVKGSPFAHPTIMMKKGTYDSLRGYNVSRITMRAEDLDLWFRFFKEGFYGYNIQTPLYYYHESIDDFNKRSLKAAIGIAKVRIKGYKMLGFSKYNYIFAIKPIISAILPNRIMVYYHSRKLNR